MHDYPNRTCYPEARGGNTMTKDKFIWREPLDSEEVKQMALEETVPHVDDEEAGNVVFSCPEHGKETLSAHG